MLSYIYKDKSYETMLISLILNIYIYGQDFKSIYKLDWISFSFPLHYFLVIEPKALYISWFKFSAI